jgi:hypothetical protein
LKHNLTNFNDVDIKSFWPFNCHDFHTYGEKNAKYLKILIDLTSIYTATQDTGVLKAEPIVVIDDCDDVSSSGQALV